MQYIYASTIVQSTRRAEFINKICISRIPVSRCPQEIIDAQDFDNFSEHQLSLRLQGGYELHTSSPGGRPGLLSITLIEAVTTATRAAKSGKPPFGSFKETEKRKGII